MPKHLVWDWNGTLLNDFTAVVRATNTTIATVNGEQLEPDAHRERFRRPVIEFYSDLVGRELSAAEFATLDAMFHADYEVLLPECGLSDGATDAIAAWRGTQSLLSMWFHDPLVRLVSQYGLTERFARVDGRADTSPGDAKLPYLLAHLEAIGVEPRDCVLIGDSVDDCAAAHAAGASCVLYTGGFTAETKLTATGAPVAKSLTAAVDLAVGM